MSIYRSVFGLQDIYARVSHIIGLVNVKFVVITEMSRLIHVQKIISESHRRWEALLKLSEAAEWNILQNQIYVLSSSPESTFRSLFMQQFWLESFQQRQESIRLPQEPFMVLVCFWSCGLENPESNDVKKKKKNLTIFFQLTNCKGEASESLVKHIDGINVECFFNSKLDFSMNGISVLLSCFYSSLDSHSWG